ncbi:hypothetical protein EBZ39_05570 [bacterium]|nr:hypothetical protein [bacterium]
MVIGFGSLLGIYLAERFQTTKAKVATPAPEPVQVVEQKDAHPEEVRPLPDISSEELAFRERALRVLEDFPKKSVLKEKDRELHKPPKELIDASGELGAIEDLLDKNPELTKEGLRFYRRCALKEDLLTSLRALCLHNLKTRAKKSGFDKKIRWSDFPDHLHRISDKL